jgi:hypothetical protein
MANVRGPQSNQGGYHTSAQIKKTHKPEYARDDINQAFAGEENNGPFSDTKTDHSRSTHVKSRKTEASKTRTPMR